MVEHAAGRADDDLAPREQFFDLAANRLAAVDGHRVNLATVRELDHFLAHLHGQLAGGHQDQGLRALSALGRLHAFEDRNDEGGGLAGAGAGLAQHVDSSSARGIKPA